MRDNTHRRNPKGRLCNFFESTAYLRPLATAMTWVWRRRQFARDFRTFRRLASERPRLPVNWKERRPYLADRGGLAGFDAHYFLHQAWAARVLAETQPIEHYDFSSHLDFCAIVSGFIPVRFFDLKPLPVRVDRLHSATADLMQLDLPSDSVSSVSCLHVIEHIGLGRYGDRLDANGDLKAMAELERILAPGGQLLIAVPVGRPRVVFNAHRVYDPDDIVSTFRLCQLREFSLIQDGVGVASQLLRNADPALAKSQECGCGCFHLRRS